MSISRALLMILFSATAQAQEPAFTAVPGKGLSVRAGDDSFAMTLSARAVFRQTRNVTGSDDTNDLGIKTLRLNLGGHAFSPDLRYRIQLALASGDFETGNTANSSPIFDAFIDYGNAKGFHLMVGQYFVPFDRARTIREFGLQFVDRQQLISELNLDRDVGLALVNDSFFGGHLGATIGIFSGNGRNRTTAEAPGFLYTARATYRPWGEFDEQLEGDLNRGESPRLALGVAAAYNQATARQKSTIGATGTVGTFDYRHLATDLVFKYRGFSFLGEVMSRKSDRDSISGNVSGVPTTQLSRSGWGYLLQGGMMITSKLEGVARWNRLFAYGATDPALITQARGQGKEAALGANYYFNGHLLKLQADYSQRFGDGSLPTNHVSRLQLDISF